MPTNLEEAERSKSVTRVVVFQAGVDDVEKCLYQQLRWQTGDGVV